MLSERTLGVLKRWSEIHIKKLLYRKKVDTMLHKNPFQCSMDTNRTYKYNDCVTVEIYYILCCKNDNEEWIECFQPFCLKNQWIVCCKVSISNYKDDVLFTMYITDESQVQLVHDEFDKYKDPSRFCMCGRLARHDHVHAIKNGTCNNCYIYGFVRGEECSICMLDDGKPWIKTSCNHYFHDLCWSNIEISRYGIIKCPLCRSDQDENTIERL